MERKIKTGHMIGQYRTEEAMAVMLAIARRQVERLTIDDTRTVTVTVTAPREDRDRVMKTELHVKAGTLLSEKGKKLLDAALEYWETLNQETNSSAGAVVWLQGDDGALAVFTRGEYRDDLKRLIDTLT